MLNKLICRFFGHKWLGAGWGAPASGGDGVDLLFNCYRCHARAAIFESKEQAGARWADPANHPYPVPEPYAK